MRVWRSPENLNGTDLFPVICRQAAAAGAGVFLFGGREGVAREAGRRIAEEIDGLDIAGTHHGYLDTDEQCTALIGAINASRARIVIVALGGRPRRSGWRATVTGPKARC